MRACIIFNPKAKGGKARWFRSQMGRLAGGIKLKPTAGPGGARPLVAEALAEGFDTLIAAGGDGTLNEVVNGLGDVPGGFDRARLAVIPLGTANVFARELALPFKTSEAWNIVLQGKEIQVDLGLAEWNAAGSPKRRYFLQLGGAGLDARAVELLNHRLKTYLGPLAYVWAGLCAMREKKPIVRAIANGEERRVELILLGNGRRYGGPLPLFPYASLKDGRLDATLFDQANFSTLFRVAGDVWSEKWVHLGGATHWQTDNLRLEAVDDARIPFELDGELTGHLPLTVRVCPKILRVIC